VGRIAGAPELVARAVSYFRSGTILTASPPHPRDDGTKSSSSGLMCAVYPTAFLEADMPVILWLLGVPAIVVIALMVTHVI
jgi:hypothetical protein